MNTTPQTAICNTAVTSGAAGEMLSRITTGNNRSVTFTYYDSTGGNDAMTVRQMDLSEGQQDHRSYF